MPRIPSRFRRPKAQLRVEWDTEAPPEFSSGGVVRLRIELLPLEHFSVRSGRLELALQTTLFSQTALDGYHEHTTEELYQAVALCENVIARPGQSLRFFAGLRLPGAPPPDSRPTRRQWQARARFEIEGRRELSAARLLRDVTPAEGGAPVVDGRGFLPLYEFRSDTNP